MDCLPLVAIDLMVYPCVGKRVENFTINTEEDRSCNNSKHRLEAASPSFKKGDVIVGRKAMMQKC